MNFGEIKAFHSEQPQSAKPRDALNKQLQAEGLQQAANFQSAQVAKSTGASISVLSSQTTVGLKIYSGSMQQNVVVNDEKASQATTFDKDKPASMFDFEKVAENVMRFVGSVIKGAARGGADDAKLASLFEQARSGVAKGIKMAEQDIGGLMNDEIDQGINSSRQLIAQRIAQLEQQLLRPEDVTAETVSSLTQLSASQENNGSLVIRTKEGDEVTLTFRDLQSVAYLNEASFTRSINDAQAEGANQPNSTEQQASEQQFGGSGQSFSQSLQAKTLDFSGYSIQIKGDLNENELASIADLVANANDLADTFYRGDIESAFNQALELGYDKQELVGFALQLNRIEQTQVVQAYDYVQHYQDNNRNEADKEKSSKPVAQYIDKMLNVLDQAQQKLQSPEDYNTMINGIINEMKDVQVPDLVQAINRFHTFNQQLLDALPKSDSTGVGNE
ncbi:DUF5610 domain-containing protein [Alteromonas flava]|uniref:DUF5610 domain-containing protein n=1 Tax=Alteromonas flava TaxID=2048003 RepID=UPI000C28ED0D|nr:DUF5610 domain-containing protein [Alteromonas flava]